MGLLLFFAFIALLVLGVPLVIGSTKNRKNGNIPNRTGTRPDIENAVLKRVKTEKWMDNKWEQENKEPKKFKK
jgi:hypothetical protein